jgi:hypothetical protein
MTALLPYFLRKQEKAIKAAEDEIIRQIVIDMLVAGHSISVNAEENVQLCRSIGAIMGSLRKSHEDMLYVHTAKGAQIGWIKLVYGENGWGVIQDYHVRLDPLMGGANAMSDHYREKFMMEERTEDGTN